MSSFLIVDPVASGAHFDRQKAFEVDRLCWLRGVDFERLAPLPRSPKKRASTVDGPFLETKEWALG